MYSSPFDSNWHLAESLAQRRYFLNIYQMHDYWKSLFVGPENWVPLSVESFHNNE